jgi:hypothetical protein
MRAAAKAFRPLDLGGASANTYCNSSPSTVAWPVQPQETIRSADHSYATELIRI